MQQRNIVFEPDFPEELTVYIDKRQFEKVVLNLLSNAVKFSPETGGRIKVTLSSQDSKATLSVSNLGIGILPEDIGRIFDRFTQGSNNDKGGMGIGLAISKYIVEVHGGEISASSVPGGETVFKVTIPLGKDHYSAEELMECTDGDDILTGNDFVSDFPPIRTADKVSGIKTHSVLVVDDNSQIREYLKELLTPFYSVIMASDGNNAYERAIAEQPDIILSDVVMPVMNGLELCAKIKGNPDTSHIPVILLSARDLPLHKIEGWKMQADDYIVKPFHSEELLARIANLIQLRESLKVSMNAKLSINPSEVVGTSSDERFLKKCISLIEKNMSDPDYGVETLSSDMGQSRPKLYRRIKELTGQTATQFIRSIRLKRARQLLAEGQLDSVTEVMEEVGFNNLPYFSKLFFAEFGVLPKDCKKNHNC